MARRVLVPPRAAVDQRLVDLVGLVPLELYVESAVGLAAAGKDHHPAGNLVESVHDPRLAEIAFEQQKQVGRIRLPAIR
jgi:hypothetical protein